MPWIPCASKNAVQVEQDRPKGTPRFHPKLLRQYDIPTKPVGEGGFGVVYLAKHVKTGDKVAIKVIAAGADSSDTVAHEVSIMQAATKRKSPHIVRIYAYEKDAWQHYLVLQACEGGELFDRIADHVFTEEEAASAVEQILKGLKACHDAGICHRDMKPENVLYATRDGSSPLLLTDFGLSTRFKIGKKSIPDWCGTTPYMAPEVFICSKERTPYGCECDLWSTGVLIYILLTGYMPFDGNESTIEANVRAGKYSMSSSVIGSISDDAKAFIKGLLCVDPDKRLTAEQALKHPWISDRHRRRNEPVSSEVKDRLQKFAKHTRLEKKLRFVIAQSMSMSEIASLKEEFKRLDTDGTGKLSHQEVHAFLQAARANPKFQDILDLVNSLDVDADGQINIVEFTAAALDTKLLLDDEKLRAVFQFMDVDKDGQLSIAELMAQLDGDPIVYDLMSQGDTDQDGKLSLAEFRSVMKRQVAALKTDSASLQAALAVQPTGQ